MSTRRGKEWRKVLSIVDDARATGELEPTQAAEVKRCLSAWYHALSTRNEQAEVKAMRELVSLLLK